MNENVLGIDLGTSSVKILQLWKDGKITKAKSGYEENNPESWWRAIQKALKELDVTGTKAVSLSSQVGTYIINDTDVISWNSGVGSREVERITQKYGVDTFVKEISMPHPYIASYPIPRLLYVKENYDKVQSICQPKDWICQMFTGKRVTDPYSWRGLANIHKKCYSRYFLKELEIDEKILPPIKDFTSLVGTTIKGTGLPEGIPVFAGLNDYFASLIGMGLHQERVLFDITGTSEHVGVLEKELKKETPLVSGPFLYYNVHYGVTASSGSSITFGRRLSDLGKRDLSDIRKKKPPIFLPYLSGERAPIWDADARGVYFGLEENHTADELAYAAWEGVVFSLYQIYETLGCPKLNSMLISGGAAISNILNQMKADMFSVPVKIVEEVDTSALGASFIAAVGAGWYPDLETAMEENCNIKEQPEPEKAETDAKEKSHSKNRLEPDETSGKWMKERYQIYKELYPAVKEQYQKWKNLSY